MTFFGEGALRGAILEFVAHYPLLDRSWVTAAIVDRKGLTLAPAQFLDRSG